jgi:uncharacterized membrane protein YphA (DoxX/SURF4 family)
MKHTALIGQVTLRYSFALLFFWFGFQQLTDASTWVTYLPEWTGYFPIPGEMLVQINGLFEVCCAALLALGIHTRIIAGFLGLHLLGIAASVGGATGVRDAALGMIGISLACQMPDAYTLDARTQTT